MLQGELADSTYTDLGMGRVYVAQGNYDAAITAMLKDGET
jgi:hypothetical protein